MKLISATLNLKGVLVTQMSLAISGLHLKKVDFAFVEKNSRAL